MAFTLLTWREPVWVFMDSVGGRTKQKQILSFVLLGCLKMEKLYTTQEVYIAKITYLKYINQHQPIIYFNCIPNNKYKMHKIKLLLSV